MAMARARDRSRRQPARRWHQVGLALALLALLPLAAAQHTYDVDRYHTYVSRGSWWPHASTTNNTPSALTWRVSYSVRRCSEWSGAVRLAREARSSMGRSSCRTSSFSASTTLAPYTSAALLRRDMAYLHYYEIRKYHRASGRLVDRGHATERDTFQEYTFSAYN